MKLAPKVVAKVKSSNQFLVACLDGAYTDEPTLAGPDGRISMEKVLRNDKYGHMKEALEKGMHWQIIDPRAEEMYGAALPNLVQRARQAVGQVQNEESLLELCLDCNMIAAAMIEKEGDIKCATRPSAHFSTSRSGCRSALRTAQTLGARVS